MSRAADRAPSSGARTTVASATITVLMGRVTEPRKFAAKAERERGLVEENDAEGARILAAVPLAKVAMKRTAAHDLHGALASRVEAVVGLMALRRIPRRPVARIASETVAQEAAIPELIWIARAACVAVKGGKRQPVDIEGVGDQPFNMCDTVSAVPSRL